MKTRSAEVDLTWNGAAVKSKMLGQTTEITYTDPASGEADSLDISIHDRDRQWTVAWLPLEGDTLEAAIKISNWDREGDNRTLPCGFSSWTISSLRGGRSPGPYPPCLYRRTVHFGKPSGQRHGRKSRSRRSGKRLQAGPELLWPGMWRGRHSRSNPLSSQARQIVTFTCRCARATATP